MFKKPVETLDQLKEKSLKNTFAPASINFLKDSIGLETRWSRTYRITNFPPKAGAGWLSHAAHLQGVVMSIQSIPTDPTKMITSLNRATTQLLGQLAVGGDALSTQRKNKQIEDAQSLMSKVDLEQQSLFETGVFLTVHAPNQEEGLRRSKRLEATLAASQIRVRPMVWRQEDGYRATMPWVEFPSSQRGTSPYQMPAETIAASFPMSSSGINHESGIVLGKDQAGSLVVIDRWKPPSSSGVANKNQVILATSGAGKSYAAMATLIREWAQGAKVIIVDPEREFQKLCRSLEGTWINVGSGGTRINPFEAVDAPVDLDLQEEDEKVYQGSPINRQLQRVKLFLDIYLPDLSHVQKSLLNEAVQKAYEEKGITAETNPSSVDVWPTIKDLYSICKAAGDDDLGILGEESNQSLRKDWQILGVLLQDAAVGTDAALWSGQSTVKADSDFIVLDIHDLETAEERVRRAQYTNILGYAWDLIRADRTEKKILAVDEAWMLIDPKVPQALNFLKSMAKRIRKYSGALMVISQNPIDFLAPEIAKEGEPILASASFKLLLRQEGKDLPTITALYGLSEVEGEKLSSAKVGEGLMIAGNDRAWVNIMGSPYEESLMRHQLNKEENNE